MKITFIFALFALSSFAGPNWYCTEVASERSGDLIRACGVGEGRDENEARARAFENAKKEFANICRASDDCKTKKVSVNPQRSECSLEANGRFKCRRLIEVIVSEEDRAPDPLPPKRITQKKPSPLSAAEERELALLEKNFTGGGLTQAEEAELVILHNANSGPAPSK
jgi:hypothetical protein